MDQILKNLKISKVFKIDKNIQIYAALASKIDCYKDMETFPTKS